MKKQSKETRFYEGIKIDSDEEEFTLWYLFELKERGYITSIERAESFSLSESVINSYTEIKQLKTKVKELEKNQKLLESHCYTGEFRCIFSDIGAKLFVDIITNDKKKLVKPFIGRREFPEGVVVCLEVKPNYDAQGMTRLFKINQKWVYDKFGVYVNLVKPLELFEKCFTPQKYLLTPTGKQRVIHIPVRSLDEYLKTIQ